MQTPNFFDRNNELNDVLKKFDELLKYKKNAYFDVDTFSEIINHLIETNQKGKARQAIKMAKKQHPASNEIKIKEVQIEIISNNTDKAKHILKNLLKLNGENPEIYYYFGKLYVTLQKLPKAVRYYNSAIDLAEPEEKQSLLYLVVDDLIDKNEYAHAVNYLYQIIEFDQFDFEAHLDLGTCYKELGQLSKAIDIFDKYLDRDPFNEMIWYQIGAFYELSGNEDKAISAYEFAVALEPEYGSAYFNLALLFSRQKNYKNAIKHLQLLIEQEPNNLHAYFYMAESYYQLNEIEKAMENYEKTLAISPTFADAWFGIGEIYYDEEKIAESLIYIRKAIKYNSKEPLFWHRLGMIQQDLNFLNYAKKTFAKVLQLDPYDEYAAIHLAECYFESKEFEKVMSFCEKFLTTFSHPTLNFLWGASHIEIDEQKAGLQQIELGLKKDHKAFDNFIYFYPKILSFDDVKKLYNQYQIP